MLIIMGIVCPLIIGAALGAIAEERKQMLAWYVNGHLVLLGLFEIFGIMAWKLGMPFSRATIIWVIISGMLMLISFAFCIKKRMFTFHFSKKTDWSGLAFCGLVAVQILICILYVFLDEYDAYYVGTAATTIETNKIFAFSPFTGQEAAAVGWRSGVEQLPVYWAVMSDSAGLHPAYFMHTLVPVFFIPVHYGIVYKALALFIHDKKQLMGSMWAAGIVNMFIGINHETYFKTAITVIWQNDCLFYNIIIPYLFYTLIKSIQTKNKMYFVMFGLGMPAALSTGTDNAVLAVLAGGVLGICCIIYGRLEKEGVQNAENSRDSRL